MRPWAAYVLASLCCGAVAVWASELLFWFVPPPDVTPLTVLGLWGLYSLAAAGALSAVLWAGAEGWPAAFLGGAILGYLVEGAALSTAYDAFPVQLVWTPLAWHGLVGGGVVLALLRARTGAGRRAGLWAALGLGLAAWGQYWAAERGSDLTGARLWLSLLGGGAAAALAGEVLGRIGRLPVPSRGVLLAAPALWALVWAGIGVATADPRRLVLPVVLVGLLWLLRRLGRGGAALDLGRGAGPSGAVALLGPVVALAVAPLWLAHGPPAPWANWAALGVTSAVSLGAVAWLARAALRRSPSRGSPAGGGP